MVIAGDQSCDPHRTLLFKERRLSRTQLKELTIVFTCGLTWQVPSFKLRTSHHLTWSDIPGGIISDPVLNQGRNLLSQHDSHLIMIIGKTVLSHYLKLFPLKLVWHGYLSDVRLLIELFYLEWFMLSLTCTSFADTTYTMYIVRYQVHYASRNNYGVDNQYPYCNCYLGSHTYIHPACFMRATISYDVSCHMK